MSEDAAEPRPPPPDAGPDDIAAQAAMFRLMVENSIDMIIRYDAERRRQYVSPSSRELLGYEPEELLGASVARMIHPDDFAATDVLFRQVGKDKPSLNLTFRCFRKDGNIIWIEGKYRYLNGDGGSVAVLRDVTEQKQAEAMLAKANETLETANRLLRTLAQQDGLTGLANRRRFDELLVDEFRRARRQELPLSVLMIDVDCFKAYNDRYGHLAGDECLRQISRAIESGLRRAGDHAARYGGEEFVALLSATEASGALSVAETIRKAVADLKIEHLGSPFGIATVSIGIRSAIPTGAEDDPGRLVAAADAALYRAKADGRNRVAVHMADVLTAVR